MLHAGKTRSGFIGLAYASVCVTVILLTLQLGKRGSSSTNLLQLVRIVIPVLPYYGPVEVPHDAAGLKPDCVGGKKIKESKPSDT